MSGTVAAGAGFAPLAVRGGRWGGLRDAGSWRKRLLQRCACEQLQLFALGESIETVGVAARFGVHVDLVAYDGIGNDGVSLMLLFQGLELVEDLLGGDGLLVDPALLALGGLHLHKAAAVFEDFELVAVVDGCCAIGDGGYAVAQKRLLRRDVHILRGRLGAKFGASA